MEKEWNRSWDSIENQPWYPDEQVVRFLARYITRKTGFKTTDVQTCKPIEKPVGLDLGCGKGRHVILMCEMNITSYGYDLSHLALNFAEQWLKTRGFSANLQYGSIDKLPYEDNKFDFVICHGVMDHVLEKIRKNSINEIYRVLKHQGLLFTSLISEKDSAYGKGIPVEKESWLIQEGYEKNIPQAFFSLERIKDEFQNFQIENITRCDSENIIGRSLIGTDKHYQLDSRYYVTARRTS